LPDRPNFVDVHLSFGKCEDAMRGEEQQQRRHSEDNLSLLAREN
jgi:hypothetical protein